MTKKSVSVILSVSVLVLAIALACFSYAGVDARAADETPSGDLTEFISSESDFVDFIVDCGIGATEGKTYILTTDIYLTRYYAAGGGSLGRGAVFEGTLDGRGHAIVGVRISDGNVQNAFFKEISPSATVKNLKLIDAEVSGSDVAALTVFNYGVVENVCVTGTVKGYYTAAGIAVYNFGAIRNCVTAVTLEGSDGAAYAATASGSEAAGLIPEEYTVAGYTPLYEISGCYGLSGQKAAIFFTDGNVTEPDEATNAAAGGVSDYALLKWYLDNYSASDVKPVAAQKAYINCYNVALTAEENAALEEAIGGGYYSVAHYGFLNAINTSNSALTSHDTDYSTITGTDTGAYTASATLEGEGTKESPYLIANVSDLLAINGFDGTGKYFMLTADIDLYVSAYAGYYPASGAFVTELEGTLDGNGKTVSALAGALIGAITASGKVTSLNVIGNGANGLVAETNNGIIEYVYADGAGCAAGDNRGTITRSTVKTGGGVANTSSGTVSYTRHYGGNFFATSGTSAEYSYNVAESSAISWNSDSLLKCVSVDPDGNIYVSEDTDITSLVTVKTTDKLTHTSAPVYSTGWKFASSVSWGFLSGAESDIPVLVFPEDNAAYKGVTAVYPSVTSVERKYGSIVYSAEETVTGLPASDGIFAGSDADIVEASGGYYYKLADGAATLPTNLFERIVNGFIPDELFAYIEQTDGAPVRYSWYSVTASGENELATDNLGTTGGATFRFRIAHKYLWVSGEVTLDASNALVANFSYAAVPYGIGIYDMYGDLALASLGSSFEALGFTRPSASTDPLGYEGIVSTLTFNGEVYADTMLYEIGDYSLTVNIPSTTFSTAETLVFDYRVKVGTLSLDGYAVASAKGGLNESDAPVYDGNPVEVPQNTFTIENFVHYGVNYSYEILSFTRYDGTVGTKPASFVQAGIYRIKLTVNVPNYETYTREFDFYVARRNITVTPYLAEDTVKYYDKLPSVSYNSELGVEATTAMFSGGLAYETAYVPGSNVGKYSVSVKINNANANANYVLIAGEAATFDVIQADMDLSACGFEDMSVVYDGKSHAVALDTSKIKLASGDNKQYTYTVTYYYAGEPSSVPFAFVNAGTYTGLGAVVEISSGNYNSATLSSKSVVIDTLGVTLEAEDAYVNYGFDAAYTLKAYRTDGGAEVENYLDNLTVGVDYSIGSDYVKNATKAGSVLPITLKLLGESNVKGNYRVTVSSKEAFLTVGKRSYTVNMKNTYVYTGEPVVLDFNGASYVFDEGYPKYYILSGGTETPFTGIPTDANVKDGDVYRNAYCVELKISESDEFYGYEETLEFYIEPAATVLSGLYVTHSGSSAILTDGMRRDYDGSEFVIAFNPAELGKGAAYTVKYGYTLTDEAGVRKRYESAEAITFKDAVLAEDITLELTPTTANYTAWKSTAAVSFEIVPLTVSFLSELASVEYKGAPYSEAEIADMLNALTTEGVISGETVSFGVKCAESAELPAEYALTVTSLNKNYIFASGASSTLVFTVTAAEVTLDFTGKAQSEYVYGELYRKSGKSYPDVALSTEFTLGGAPRTETVVYYIGTTTLYPVPYEYDIISADPLIVDGVEAVRFTVTGAEKAVKIKPCEVSFDWGKVNANFGFEEEYSYNGAALAMPASFDLTYVDKGPVTFADGLKVNISYSAELKHAGFYTLTAEAVNMLDAPDGTKVNCYSVKGELKEFTVTILPATVRYEITPATVYLGASVPDTFSVNYVEGYAPFATDTLAITYTVPGFDSSAPATFAVFADIKVLDGEKLYADYIAEKANAEAKELTVAYHAFPDETTVNDVNVTYTGLPAEIPVSGLPADTEVTVEYSSRPVNAGEYTVTVTLKAEGYLSESFTVKVNISAATPEIRVSEREPLAYRTGYVLSSADITSAEAYFGSVKLEGTFDFTERTPKQSLVYGRYTYSIVFTPTSSNFAVVKNIPYVITSYVDTENAFSVTGKDPSADTETDIDAISPDVTESVSALHSYVIKADIAPELAGAAYMYVNGAAVIGDEYTVTTSGKLKIEIRLGTEVLLTRILEVTIEDPESGEPDGPEAPGEDDNEGGNSSGAPEGGNGGGTQSGGVNVTMSEETKKKWIIGGSVAGGVVLIGAIVAVVIVAVKKKKDKSGEGNSN